jgi:nicotinate-nucleotide pyrophosphorylase (carboxylating)
MNLSEADIRPLIQLAFKEDINTGDITSEAIFTGTEKSNAYIMAKADGVFCGGEVLRLVYNDLDPSVTVKLLVADGAKVRYGDIVCEIEGRTISILLGERTALNFIQRMSGVATKTASIASLVSGTKIKILDTRKTIPGFRLLDKYAVKCGGGENHRIGLYDMILIKDNHIKAVGGISNAVANVRAKWGTQYRIEVETSNLDEVQQAIDSKADIIMLDNMDKELMKKAVTLVNKQAKIEISGNMNAEKIKELTSLDIDYISIGSLTHSVEAFDLSMKFR